MISLTTVHIQMQIQGNTKHRRLRCSGTNRLLISGFGSSTRGETQFLKLFCNHTMLTTYFNGRNLTLCPKGRNSTIVFHGPTSKSQLPGRTPTSQHDGRNSTSTVSHNGRQPNFLPTWFTVNLPTHSFSKSSNSQDHRFLG